jgi:hypothetical protein
MPITANYHVKRLDVSVQYSTLINSDLTKYSFVPEFYLYDNLLLRWHIVDKNGTAIDLTGYSFYFGIDYVYTTGNADLIISDNTNFKSADWSEWDLSQGKMCCRVRMNSTALTTLLADDEKVDAYGVLWAYKSGEINKLITHFPLTLKNSIIKIEDEYSSESSSSSSTSSLSSSSSSTSSSSSSLDDVRFVNPNGGHTIYKEVYGGYTYDGQYNSLGSYTNGAYYLYWTGISWYISAVKGVPGGAGDVAWFKSGQYNYGSFGPAGIADGTLLVQSHDVSSSSSSSSIDSSSSSSSSKDSSSSSVSSSSSTSSSSSSSIDSNSSSSSSSSSKSNSSSSSTNSSSSSSCDLNLRALDNDNTVGGFISEMATDGLFVYSANTANGLTAWDASGDNLVKITTIDDTGTAYGVYCDGTYIYVADGIYGIKAYTFNGASFTNVGSINEGGVNYGITGDGTYIYVNNLGVGVIAYTFNGSTFTNVAFNNVFGQNYFGIAHDGTYLYTAHNTGGLRAWTFNGSAFAHVGTSTPGAIVFDVYCNNGIIYVANGTGGLRAFTFSGSSFISKGTTDDGTEYFGVFANNEYVFCSTGSTGIKAYTHNTINNTFTLESTLSCSTDFGLVLKDDYFYYGYANGTIGLAQWYCEHYGSSSSESSSSSIDSSSSSTSSSSSSSSENYSQSSASSSSSSEVDLIDIGTPMVTGPLPEESKSYPFSSCYQVVHAGFNGQIVSWNETANKWYGANIIIGVEGPAQWVARQLLNGNEFYVSLTYGTLYPNGAYSLIRTFDSSLVAIPIDAR